MAVSSQQSKDSSFQFVVLESAYFGLTIGMTSTLMENGKGLVRAQSTLKVSTMLQFFDQISYQYRATTAHAINVVASLIDT